MFYFPGSWYIGTALQWLINIWMIWDIWPLGYGTLMDWDDNERRGAGSLCIVFVIIVLVVLSVLWVAGVI